MSPATPEGGTRMSRTKHTDRNLAARMGRWSADHWKTATFGWLAFVLVAFGLGGAVGTKNIAELGRAGRVRPDGPDPRGGLRAARVRARLDPEPVATCRHDRLRCGDRGRRRAHLENRGRPQRPLAAPARKRDPDRRTGTPHWSSSRSAATRRRLSTRSAPSWTRLPLRNVPIPASRSASSAMRAPRRGSWPPMTRTSARPARSHFRSR